jgi:hypothetical protein
MTIIIDLLFVCLSVYVSVLICIFSVRKLTKRSPAGPGALPFGLDLPRNSAHTPRSGSCRTVARPPFTAGCGGKATVLRANNRRLGFGSKREETSPSAETASLSPYLSSLQCRNLQSESVTRHSH